jgi:hypothetical protein
MPSKEFRKLALGSSTLVPPPKTTKPVITMKRRMISLTAEIKFINRIDQRVEIRHRKAKKE